MRTMTQTRDHRTARQLANDYSRAKANERCALTRQDQQAAHDAASQVWREARARAGKDWAVFSRIIHQEGK